jgi:hypothetical protein
MGAGNLTDEQLLKRASQAGRNLAVLTILATLVALVLWALLFLGKGMAPLLSPLAVAVTLLSAGYWSLAIAARRGNPTSVGIVLVIMVTQLLFVFVSAGVAAARTKTEVSTNLPGLAIPIFVFIALVSSRSVLLELQARGLWEQAFGSVKPSGGICVVGGVLVAAGLVLFDGGSTYAGWRIGQARAAEYREAKGFVEVIKNEEQEFMTAMGGVLNNAKGANLELALSKVSLLESKVDSLQTQMGDGSSLPSILQTYRNAVRQWKNALLALKEPKPDRHRAQQMLALGDKFRAQATQEFQRRFATKSPRSPS